MFDDESEWWPHQRFAVAETFRLISEGVRRICVTSPTGGGKTLMMAGIVKRAVSLGLGVTVFANRKLLIDQLRHRFDDFGIPFGVRAAGHGRDVFEAVQIASIPTENSRMVKRKEWDAHPCGLFVVDEAHMNENPSSRKVYDRYVSMGATKVGFTATPLGLGGCYDELVVAGATSELRACGALVPAVHYGCTEPDLRNVRRIPIGEELTEADAVKLIMAPGIHGYVLDHFRRLNPQMLPTIGFAPGVGESIGFARAFEEAGIPAAHIDGESVWIRGKEYPSTEERRNDLLEMSRTGQVRVVWNRFVLREAVDMPWLRHGILATVFGSLQSYLQSGGRLLRACPVVGKDRVTVQDHGGNWWRHGSLNSDRRWKLGDTSRVLAQLRADAIAGNNEDGEPKEPEPFLCPGCKTVLVMKLIRRSDRSVCGTCGYAFDFSRRSRPVIQADGELVEHPGSPHAFRRRQTERRHDTADLWERMYWRMRNAKKKMTFTQARGMFVHEHGYAPDEGLPLMPKKSIDWHLYVKDVPWSDLVPKPPKGQSKKENP